MDTVDATAAGLLVGILESASGRFHRVRSSLERTSTQERQVRLNRRSGYQRINALRRCILFRSGLEELVGALHIGSVSRSSGTDGFSQKGSGCPLFFLVGTGYGSGDLCVHIPVYVQTLLNNQFRGWFLTTCGGRICSG